MATFTCLEIWSDLACNAGVRKATFWPDELTHCVLTQSLAGTEQLAFGTSRLIEDGGEKVAELVHARIARVCWSDTTLDTEWRLADDEHQSGSSDRGQLSWVAQSLVLDLGRAPYVAFDSQGRPSFDITGTALTATEWLNTYVLPAVNTEASLFPVDVGTIEFTNLFDLDGSYQTALEIIRAICAPARAPGDFVLRRNGATNYLIDILASRGSTAATVRVQTAKNLLANVRKRSLVAVGTKIIPRGDPAATVRGMERAFWKVASVTDGTHAVLSDIQGGANPGSAFTDQLKDLYVARLVSTFSSQQIAASTTAGSITVASTAGWSAGDYVEFRRTAGANGERVIDVRHPTLSLDPASGGYGARTLLLDVPAGLGDANLCPNPWTRAWANAANPPDGWSNDGSGTFSQETTIIRFGATAYRVLTPGGTYTMRSPTFYPFTTAGLTHSAHAWLYLVQNTGPDAVQLRIMKPDLSVTYSTSLNVTGPIGEWIRVDLQDCDLSSATAGVKLVVVTGGSSGTLEYIVGALSLNDGATDIADVEYSGGTVLHQAANVKLAAVASPVAGYELGLLDLARLDGSDWSDEPLVLGGTLEVVDADLAVTTSQRVVELVQDVKNPLNATVQLQTRDRTLTLELAA